MIGEGEDGFDHINIYSKGKTELGRWMSNFTYAPIEVPHGKFTSIEGYWYFLKTGDERFKHLHGYKAKALGDSLPDKAIWPANEFQFLICQAIDQKLRNGGIWLRHFSESILPFCHYYEYGGKRVDAGYEWIIEHFEDRRRLLKEHYGKTS